MSFITTPRIDVKSLKCKGVSCEFYGNSQWGGFCSKCHREKSMRERIAQSKLFNQLTNL